MAKIIITDGAALNPGDLSWEGIERLGEVTLHERTEPEKIVERCAGAEIVLSNKVPFSRETIQQLPDLKYIGVTATGYNVIDTAACAERGIVVTNVPHYTTNGVAEFVISLILHHTRRIDAHADSVRQGGWQQSPDFSYWVTPQQEVYGKTLGIIGWGTIGKQVGRIASAMDMDILAFSRSRRDPLTRPDNMFAWASVDDILKKSDFVSLHCPLTDETRHLVNDRTLGLMKSSAMLINTARGPLVDEEALVRALKEKRLAAAAVDVLDREPPVDGSPLIGAPNCVVTPHMAWVAIESRKRLLDVVIANLVAYQRGKPINVVSR